MATDAYLTGAGFFLPGEPLDNDEIARRLGAPASGAAAAMRAKVLATNGIRSRHYALDRDGAPTMLNEQLAAEAVQRALKERGLSVSDIGMLAAATTQGDLLVPDNDDDHFEHLREVLRSGVVDQPRARRIVRTARIVARLYAWQLAEVDDE